jgi:hypothetical protein
MIFGEALNPASTMEKALGMTLRQSALACVGSLETKLVTNRSQGVLLLRTSVGTATRGPRKFLPPSC